MESISTTAATFTQTKMVEVDFLDKLVAVLEDREAAGQDPLSAFMDMIRQAIEDRAG